jgi:multiple sugar transport system permease protein
LNLSIQIGGKMSPQIFADSKKYAPSERTGFRKFSEAGLSTYLMLSPFALLFIVFAVYPVLASLRLSFMRYNAICNPDQSPCGSVGFGNYQYLIMDDSRFHKALVNTTLYVIGSVIMGMIASLTLALALQEDTRSNRILRVIFFLPSVTSGIAIVLVWGWVFRGDDVGLLNALFNFVGLPTVEWLATPSLAIPILIFMAMWGGAGFGMVLFLAGLNSIPAMYYEAAVIDGAGPRERFRYITLPLLRPVMVYVGITGTIGAFQIFEGVYLLFPTSVGSIGGFKDMALMIVPYLYDMGFNKFRLGYASAIAWILFGIIFVISMINLKLTRSLEDLR